MNKPFTDVGYTVYNNDDSDEGACIRVKIDEDTGECVEVCTTDEHSALWFGEFKFVCSKEMAHELGRALLKISEEK